MYRIGKGLLLLLLIWCLPTKSNAQDKNYQEWYLMTNDSLQLYVREVGTGKDTVIVVHDGFGANHDYLLDAIKGLENHYHFILYDQRGSVLSPAPPEKLAFQKDVEDLAVLIDQLKIKKSKIIN